MITLKSLTIVAALLAGGTSLAMAQNGLPTGGEPPVAGGGAGNPIVDYGYRAAPGYYGYYGAPGYLAAPGYAAGPRRVATTHHRRIYMYAPRTK
jgi:hypothetical protein